MTAPIALREQHTTLGKPSGAAKTLRETIQMLIYEELARARIRDIEEAIQAQRHRRNARTGYRIARLIRRIRRQ
jgi:hypothetical protein